MTTVTVSGGASIPKMLDLVNIILNDCGIESVPSACATYNHRSSFVTRALNYAVTDIYHSMRWHWTKTWTNIPLVANQADYSLPGNFMRLCAPPKYSGIQMEELSPEEWEIFTPDTSMTPHGGPRNFKIDNLTISLYPAPSAAFVTQFGSIPYAFWENSPGSITDDGGTLDVEYECLRYLVYKVRSELKRYLNNDDWQEDARQAKAVMDDIIRSDRQGRMPPTIRPKRPIVRSW